MCMRRKRGKANKCRRDGSLSVPKMRGLKQRCVCVCGWVVCVCVLIIEVMDGEDDDVVESSGR